MSVQTSCVGTTHALDCRDDARRPALPRAAGAPLSWSRTTPTCARRSTAIDPSRTKGFRVEEAETSDCLRARSCSNRTPFSSTHSMTSCCDSRAATARRLEGERTNHYTPLVMVTWVRRGLAQGRQLVQTQIAMTYLSSHAPPTRLVAAPPRGASPQSAPLSAAALSMSTRTKVKKTWSSQATGDSSPAS